MNLEWSYELWDMNKLWSGPIMQGVLNVNHRNNIKVFFFYSSRA